MKVVIQPGQLSGVVQANPSKSFAHRALITAALADAVCEVGPIGSSDDVVATMNCLKALGAQFDSVGKNSVLVKPISRSSVQVTSPSLPCRESGSTLRFLLPVAAAVSSSAQFTAEGRLPERPSGPLIHQMERHGVRFPQGHGFPLQMEGRLTPGRFSLRGDISSQYFTGLLLALPLLDVTSEICLESPLQSAGYVDLTIEVLRRFGVRVERTPDSFVVPGGQRPHAPGRIGVEGDWSSASFWLCAGAMGAELQVGGLSEASTQGDRHVLKVLENMGARVVRDGALISVKGGALQGCEVDVSQIPDAMPVLSIIAAYAAGITHFVNAGRLRLKESDRLAAMAELLTAMKVRTGMTEDSLTVYGTDGHLQGGAFDSRGDHRLAMSLAVAAMVAESPVTIHRAECVAKSYPDFYKVYRQVGGRVEEQRENAKRSDNG